MRGKSKTPLNEMDENKMESGKIKKRGATIDCEDLSFLVGRGEFPKSILSNLNIVFQPGELVALMGPSGAGKTTLLNVLSGRATGHIIGSVVVDGIPLDSAIMKKTTCIVPQHDILIGCLTARTALQYAADMRLNCSAAEKKKKIDDVLKELSLTECADVIIGSEDVKGLSGGQRKRVCIALELITDPRVLFLDEPTTGLDSRIAEDVIMLLQQLARAGRTIICTIHQPSEKVFNLFDKLVMLRKGKLCYHADVKRMHEYFTFIKEPITGDASPPEHFFNILAIKESPIGFDSFQSAFTSWDKKRANAKARRQSTTVKASGEFTSYPVPRYIQFWALFRRHLYKSLKEPIVTLVRIIQVVFISLFVGSIYYQLPVAQNYYNDRFSVIFLLIMLNGITTMLGQIITMPVDKTIFLKEYRNGYYPAYVYFWSTIMVNMMFQFFYDVLLSALTYYTIGLYPTLTAFITFCGVFMLIGGIGIALGFGFGCLLQDVVAAVALMPVLLCPLTLFTGLLLKPENIPIWWKWMYYLSFFQYSFQLLVVNEFQHINFAPCDKAVPLPNVDCPFGFCNSNATDPYGLLSDAKSCPGTLILDLMGYKLSDQNNNWYILSAIFVSLLIFAWFSFKKLSRKPI